MTNPNHCVCIHGHFYQPPRENPWLGVIEPQPSAAPFHDWNERIHAECYAAGARARLHDAEGRIEGLANNFLHLSFNIGPTLLRWLARHHPETTARILAADRASAARLDGHGNAIAQVYNHMILPLAAERDRQTQIVWGLADFAHRFGRPAESIWLAECAIDMQTVRALVDHGIRYILLAPQQAGRVRHLDSSVWLARGERPLDCRHPYRLYEKTPQGQKQYQRHLDVFFYDGGIAHGIAFGKLLRDAGALAAAFAAGFDPDASIPQLVHTATDGESYGHHEPCGEICLASFFERTRRHRGETLTNYGAFLAENPPGWEVELWEGERGEGSSWSCAHGVDRWIRDCGCSDGGPDGYNQAWRTPLREAFDRLRQQLDALFLREGHSLLRDPWDGRDAYIQVLLDPSARDRFLKAHAPRAHGDAAREAAVWALLEMQHNAMLMYTSCGWYFADIAGLEPVQNMRYALRAIEYARRFTSLDLESQLLSDLERAHANRVADGTGGSVFRRQVRPSAYPPETLAACYALLQMCGLPQPAFCHAVDYVHTEARTVGWLHTFHGILLLEDRALFQTTRYAFLAAHISDREAGCLVRICQDDLEAETVLQAWLSLPPQQLTLRLRSEGHLIREMPHEQRELLLHHVLGARLAEVNQTFSETYDQLRPLLAILAENAIEPPAVMRVAAESVLTKRFAQLCENLAQQGCWDEQTTLHVEALIEEAKLYHLEIDRAAGAPCLAELLLDCLRRLSHQPELSVLQEAIELVGFCRQAGLFFENGGKLENAYWHLLRHRIAPLAQALRRGALEDEAQRPLVAEQVARVQQLGQALNFAEHHLDRLLDFLEHAEPDEGGP